MQQISSFEHHILSINDFDQKDFFTLHSIAPDGQRVSTSPIHPQLAELLEKEDHVSISNKRRSVELVYGKGEDNIESKYANILKTLIDLKIADADDKHNSEMLDVYESAALRRCTAKCPRTLMPFLGYTVISVVNFLYERGPGKEDAVWLGERIIELNKPPRRGTKDVAAGTCAAGETPADTLEHETLHETGLRLAQAPLHEFAGIVLISRRDAKWTAIKRKLDRKGIASMHEVMFVWTTNIGDAKNHGLIPQDFTPKSHEVPPKTSYWKSFTPQEMVHVFDSLTGLVRGKACAAMLSMHTLGMLRGTDVDAHVAHISSGLNGSLFRAMCNAGKPIELKRPPDGRLARGRAAPSALIA